MFYFKVKTTNYRCLDSYYSNVPQSATSDVGYKVSTGVLGVGLIPLFGRSSFGSFPCPWRHVVEPGQEAGTLGLDDGHREGSSKLVEDETPLTVGDWAAFHLRDVGCFGCNKTFKELMKVL